MATSCTIAKYVPGSNKIRSVYMHFDGHIERAGRGLRDHYQEPDLVELLLDMGSMSQLKPSIPECDFYVFQGKPKTQCTAKMHKSKRELISSNNAGDAYYMYLMDKTGTWRVYTHYGSYGPYLL